MNKLIFSLTLFFGLSASATSDIEVRVLEAVVKNADSFVVLTYNFDGSETFEEKPVVGLMTEALLQNYTTMGTSGGVLSAVTMSCEEKTGENDLIVGGGVYSCELTFGESQNHLYFEAIVPNNLDLDVTFGSYTIEMEVGE
jgi:hypothetical protein